MRFQPPGRRTNRTTPSPPSAVRAQLELTMSSSPAEIGPSSVATGRAFTRSCNSPATDGTDGPTDAAGAVDAFLDTVEDALKRGSEVSFSGFGKFSVSARSAREGRNPATGERIQTVARLANFGGHSAEGD